MTDRLANGRIQVRNDGLERSRPGAFALLAALLLLIGATDAGAFRRGVNLEAIREQTGIVRITAFDGDLEMGPCTATVLFSASTPTPRTWLVTTAHCFSHRNLYYVHTHAPNPRAIVHYATSTGSYIPSEPLESRVYVHPEWLGETGWHSWFGPHDVAFIRVDRAIPVFSRAGDRIDPFERPIYTGPGTRVGQPESDPHWELFAKNAFCGYASRELRCDTLRRVRFTLGYRETFLQMPRAAWRDGMYQSGDSGGPLLKYAPGLSRSWQGRKGIEGIVRHGVVVGVLQGPMVWCDFTAVSDCDVTDGLAARFDNVSPWLVGIPGSQDIPRVGDWAFVEGFRGSKGTVTDLDSLPADFAYTFPAYAGRVVGIAVEKHTNRIHTWYSNGFRSLGQPHDLDVHTQNNTPGLTDVVMTHTFQPAAGRPADTIVAMMMESNGYVYTIYADQTYSVGTPGDLDRYSPPRGLLMPAWKSIDDLVGIAARPAGGVLAYYADGTVSEGRLPLGPGYGDLDFFASPTPFSMDPDRSAEEILAIGAQANGVTVTLYDQRNAEESPLTRPPTGAPTTPIVKRTLEF